MVKKSSSSKGAKKKVVSNKRDTPIKKEEIKKTPEKKQEEKVSKKVEMPLFNKDLTLSMMKKVLPVIFILIVMWFAFFVRSGPIELNGLEKNVEANIYNNIQNVIAQQVDAQYPNLNDNYKAELIQKEYVKVVETGQFDTGQGVVNIAELAKQNVESVKNAFKADNGQTYLNAIDPYYFLGLSSNYNLNGHTGTGVGVIDGKETILIDYRMAPIGVQAYDYPEFHLFLENIFFKLNGVTGNSSIGDKTAAVYLIPVIFAMLSVIPAYFIIRKFSNDYFAFMGSLLLVSVGTFVSRTVAGFVDTDAYNVFFPLVITAFLIYSFIYASRTATIVLALIAGFFQGLFLWAWGPGWFIFIFLSISLIGFIGYSFIINLINKKNLKELTNLVLNDLLVLVSFVLSSALFSYVFAKKNIITLVLSGTASSAITTISQTNIWPNVLSSVAELNPASFNQIIVSVGGTIIFLFALIGILLFALDFKGKDKRNDYIRYAVLVFGVIWFLIIVLGQAFISYTANHAFLFLGILFLPVAAALLLGIFNNFYSEKVFVVLLLSIWMAGTIYMSLNGVRFILLLAPAFAISFALGLFYVGKIINNFFAKEFKFNHQNKASFVGFAIVLALFLFLFYPIAQNANAISEGTTPNFDDAWYSTMYKIRDNSQPDAIITSWWDFGHFFATVSDRGVTFDGGSQGTPRSHWVGKLLMENDEDVSVDILRMLVCGGNEAHNTMLSYTQGTAADAVKINKILYETFGKDRDTTREIIANNKYYSFTENQVDEVMNYLACEDPAEDFLITSEDMVGKAGVWAHWGSWDFTKKYVHDNYNTKSVSEIAADIDENVTLIEQYVDELKDIDVKAQVQDIKRENLVNQWLAPYPSYVPIQGRYSYPCINNNNTLTCQNGVIVDFSTGKIDENSVGGQVSFKNLIYPDVFGNVNVLEQNPQGEFDVLILPGGNGGYNSMIMGSPLGASLFTKLFYLEGQFDNNHFEKFDDVQSATGVRVITWKVNWDGIDLGENMSSSIDVSSIDFDLSGENSTSTNVNISNQ